MRPWWGALLAVVVVGPTSALADPTDDPDVEIAHRHFELGRTAYAHGDYQTALSEFSLARRYKILPAFDYNIARCHDRLEHQTEAIEAYRRYVAAAPAADTQEARQRLRVLEERAAAEEIAANDLKPARSTRPAETTRRREPVGPPTGPMAVGVPPATAPPTMQTGATRASPLVIAAIADGVTAVLALAVGSGLYASAKADYDQLAYGGQSCRPCAPSQYAGVEARANAGYALWSIAGIAAATDVVLVILAVRARPRVPARAQARRLLFTSGGLSVGGRF